MTPLEVQILLHYHYSAEDYNHGDFSAPALRETIDTFRDVLGLLEPKPPEGGIYKTYQLTPKAQAYVDAILAMPLPVCRWEIPEAG